MMTPHKQADSVSPLMAFIQPSVRALVHKISQKSTQYISTYDKNGKVDQSALSRNSPKISGRSIATDSRRANAPCDTPPRRADGCHPSLARTAFTSSREDTPSGFISSLISVDRGEPGAVELNSFV